MGVAMSNLVGLIAMGTSVGCRFQVIGLRNLLTWGNPYTPATFSLISEIRVLFTRLSSVGRIEVVHKLGDGLRPEYREHCEVFLDARVILDECGGLGFLVDAVPHEDLGIVNK